MDRKKLALDSESGISLIEVMMAGFILTVSLLAVAATMAAGISSMFVVQEQLVAKQKAREAMESIFTARSTQNITFPNIRSVADGGIFLSDWQSIKDMGADGIANTADDGAIETLTFPGKDGNLGTADDTQQQLTNFQRRVTFSDVLLPSGDVDDEIRRITIDVRYQIRKVWWTVTVSSYISKFA